MFRALAWLAKWSAITFLVLLLFVMAVGIASEMRADGPAQPHERHR